MEPAQPRDGIAVEDNTFLDLIRQVRAGDPDAAAELVQRYEPAIRRVVRLHLRDPYLRRLLDSMDICQAVMASFFLRAASGQYHLDRPAQLVRLLSMMARHKVASQGRKAEVRRREPLAHYDEHGPRELLDPRPSPSRQLIWRDLYQQVCNHLTEDERQLLDRRADNQQWADIAAELGGSAEALRKKLARALHRVAQQVDLEELTDE